MNNIEIKVESKSQPNTDCSFPSARFFIEKILDKIIFAIAAFIVLLPLQRCQFLNNLESEKTSAIRNASLQITYTNISKLSSIVQSTSASLIAFEFSSNEDRQNIREKIAEDAARMESLLHITTALVGLESSSFQPLLQVLSDADSVASASPGYDARQGQEIAKALPTQFAKFIGKVRDAVPNPTN